MKILVCGGRHFKDYKKVDDTLDALHATTPIELVIDGDCGGFDERRGQPYGADYLAHCWATKRRIPSMRFPAHFSTMGRPAGPKRNGWMLKYGQPDLVVAFPGGKGTASMVSLAKKAGVKVIEVPD